MSEPTVYLAGGLITGAGPIITHAGEVRDLTPRELVKARQLFFDLNIQLAGTEGTLILQWRPSSFVDKPDG